MKKLLKDPIKYNLFFLTAFPVIFIILGLLSKFSDKAKTVFFAPVFVYTYIVERLEKIFGFDPQFLYDLSAKVFHSRFFWVILYIMLFALTVIACRFGLNEKTKAYKILSIFIYAVWFCLINSMFIRLGVLLINSAGIAVVLILFLPVNLLIATGIGKTVSVGKEKIIVEYEEEDA